MSGWPEGDGNRDGEKLDDRSLGLGASGESR